MHPGYDLRAGLDGPVVVRRERIPGQAARKGTRTRRSRGRSTVARAGERTGRRTPGASGTAWDLSTPNWANLTSSGLTVFQQYTNGSVIAGDSVRFDDTHDFVIARGAIDR